MGTLGIDYSLSIILVMVKYLSIILSICACLLAETRISQAQTQTFTPNSTVGDNSTGNLTPQTNQQNLQQITIPNIYPLNPVIQNPVNTENDLGINLGAGVNTLDSRNVTIYLGVTYQPGRTEDHQTRMAKLKSETQLLETQKQTTQTQLELLKQQVAEQEIRLRRLKSDGKN